MKIFKSRFLCKSGLRNYASETRKKIDRMCLFTRKNKNGFNDIHWKRACCSWNGRIARNYVVFNEGNGGAMSLSVSCSNPGTPLSLKIKKCSKPLLCVKHDLAYKCILLTSYLSFIIVVVHHSYKNVWKVFYIS